MTLFRILKIAALLALFACNAPLLAQTERCLQPGRIDVLRKQMASSVPQAVDANLRKKMISTAKSLTESYTAYTRDLSAKNNRDFHSLAEADTKLICATLNSREWPKPAAIGKDGVSAFFYIISRGMPAAKQLELYPLIVDAVAGGYLEKGEDLASLVDRLRLALGLRQLFGTQAISKDGFIVSAPIAQFDRVDEQRKEYGLIPIREYERLLETTFRMPLVRSVNEPVASETTGAVTGKTNADSSLLSTEDEVIKVETAYVSFDVIVPDAAANGAEQLERSDFKVFDNNKPVEVETFAKADTPFDIVLLLDLSGSTSNQVGLIRKTTRRFVEMKRPGDRVAIVAFEDRQTVVSELEADSEVLLKRLKDIDGYGGSRVWDAVKFGIDMLEKNSDKGRRKAIVLMSDGADNLLAFQRMLVPRMGFADLLETVQRSSVAIFPIYLDTEGGDEFSKQVYANARLTLSYLAQQSAGNMYTARKIDDLSTIYDRVLKDVGTVYTLGFTPDVEPGDDKWRKLRVEIPSKPGLKIKYRPGYFTR